MGLSRTDIINRALVHLGEYRVTTSNDNKATAKIANFMYDGTRRRMIAEAWWSFAKKFQALAASGSAEGSGWKYSHAIPVDMIDVISVNVSEVGVDARDHFEIAGNLIYSNSETCSMWFTYDPGDGARYTPHFEIAFPLALAEDISMSRTNSLGQSEALYKKAKEALATAKAKDAGRSNFFPPPASAFPYLSSRRLATNPANSIPAGYVV